MEQDQRGSRTGNSNPQSSNGESESDPPQSPQEDQAETSGSPQDDQPQTPQVENEENTVSIQGMTPLTSREKMHQLAAESGLGRELEELLRQVVIGDRSSFFAYLRGLPEQEGAEKVAALYTVIEELSDRATDLTRAFLPELRIEAPRVFDRFKTHPYLREIYKVAEKKAKQQTSAKRQRGCRKTIKMEWGDDIEDALRINDNTSRQYCEAIRMLALLIPYESANDAICVVILRRITSGGHKLSASTMDIYEAVNTAQRAAVEEGNSLPRPSAQALADRGYKKGNFELVDVASRTEVYTSRWRVGDIFTRNSPHVNKKTHRPITRSTTGIRPHTPQSPVTPSGPPVAGPSGPRPPKRSLSGKNKGPRTGSGTVKTTPTPLYKRARGIFAENMQGLDPLVTALLTNAPTVPADVEQRFPQLMSDEERRETFRRRALKKIRRALEKALENLPTPD